MKNNHNVITFFKELYKVITQNISNYKVYTYFYSNNNVITYFKNNHNVITKIILYYIVITFSFPAWSLSFNSDLTEGSLIFGQLDPGETVFIEESDLNIGKNSNNLFQIHKDKNNRFIIGIPQDAKEITLTIKNGSTSKTKTFPVKHRSWDEDYVTGLPSAKVNPNPANQKRITDESLQMRRARQNSNYASFPEKWTCPVPEHTRISSRFGSRRILNNVKKQGIAELI